MEWEIMPEKKNEYQRRRDKLAKEGIYRKGQRPDAPAVIPTEEDTVAGLMRKLPKEQADQILDEYIDKGGNDLAWLKSRLQPEQEAKQEAQVNEAELMREYKERLAKTPSYAIAALKNEMRKRGLRSIY